MKYRFTRQGNDPGKLDQPNTNQQQPGEVKNYNLIRFGNRRDFVTNFVYDAYMAILNNSSVRLIPDNEKMIEDVRWVESIADALESTGNQSWNIEPKPIQNKEPK